MKHLQKQTGFTIIELLIVIVVIGILASISAVSYTKVQDRARAEKAKTNAASVSKIAESYYSKNNTYPTTVSHFRSGLYTLASDIKLLTSGTFNSTIGIDTIVYKYVGSSSNATGACVYYWDFRTNARSAVEFLGNATSGNCGYSTGISPAS